MTEKKINILHISPDFNYSCGVSKYVFDLLERYKEDTRFDVFFLTNGGDALEKLKNAEIPYFKIGFGKGIENFIRVPYDYLKFKSIVLENKIDIIHTHHRYPEFISFLIGKKTGVKTVTTAHSFVKGFTSISFKSDKIIAVSDSIKNHIIANYPVEPDKIVTLYNFLEFPVKKGSESVREKFKIGNDEFVFLFAGRINKIKGIDLLVDSFRKIISEGYAAKLLIVGTEFDDVYAKLNARQNEGIIRVESVENLTGFYEAADAVVLPSREDPFPYVMLEAGYFSKLFIGAAVGGIAEFIDDGENGILFKKEDGAALYAAMKKAVEAKNELKNMGKSLNEKVGKLTDKENYFKKLEEIYFGLTDERNS